MLDHHFHFVRLNDERHDVDSQRQHRRRRRHRVDRHRRVGLGLRPEPAVDVKQPRATEKVLEDVQASPARRGRSSA